MWVRVGVITVFVYVCGGCGVCVAMWVCAGVITVCVWRVCCVCGGVYSCVCVEGVVCLGSYVPYLVCSCVCECVNLLCVRQSNCGIIYA